MLLGLCVGVGLVVTASSSYLLQPSLDEGASTNAFRWLQLLSTVGFFLLPALLGVFILGRSLPEGLELKRPQAKSYSRALLLGVVMIPASSFLLQLNGLIPLPDWASALEANAAQKTAELLGTSSALTMLLNLLIVALGPAVAEEFFFRGALQQALLRTVGSPHVAIWVVAVLFSLVHLQFGGFIPRLWMGAILGYVAYWSGSLWPSVLVHFLNNAVGVVTYYALTLTHHLELADADLGWPNWVFSGLCFVLAGWLLVRWERRYDSAASVGTPLALE